MAGATFFQRFSAGYWRVLHTIGNVVGGVLLGVCYFTVLAVTSVVMRLTGADLLGLRERESYYVPRSKQPDPKLDRYTHQF